MYLKKTLGRIILSLLSVQMALSIQKAPVILAQLQRTLLQGETFPSSQLTTFFYLQLQDTNSFGYNSYSILSNFKGFLSYKPYVINVIFR
jgi:hypothetical protein